MPLSAQDRAQLARIERKLDLLLGEIPTLRGFLANDRLWVEAEALDAALVADLDERSVVMGEGAGGVAQTAEPAPRKPQVPGSRPGATLEQQKAS